MACTNCKNQTAYRPTDQSWLNRFRERLAEVIRPACPDTLDSIVKEERLTRRPYELKAWELTGHSCPKCDSRLIKHIRGRREGLTECGALHCSYEESTFSVVSSALEKAGQGIPMSELEKAGFKPVPEPHSCGYVHPEGTACQGLPPPLRPLGSCP